jgi:hypothetical protein
MWIYGEKIFLFGGFDSIINHHFNDLWQFDPKTNEWTELKPNGEGQIFLNEGNGEERGLKSLYIHLY